MLCSNEVAGTTKIFDKEMKYAGHWWLMPVIPATWGAEIERVTIQGQPGK
jgi:hypothetical protein